MSKKMTPSDVEAGLRYVAREFVKLASEVGSLKVEVEALRATLLENGIPLDRFHKHFDALMKLYLDKIETEIASSQESENQRRLRRLLEEFDGPKQ